mmetsp:Transcript_96247/g.201079  ORF Transcript_96247/g.201079 Transcript_96247/m.201079 type:complete len:317 (+) Transcript_96247:140-1090(+)
MLPPANYGTNIASGKRRQKQALGLTTKDMAKAAACILGPPVLFGVVSVLLCFKLRFSFPRGVWLVAGLGIIPGALAGRAAGQASSRGEDARWQTLAAVLLLLATIVAAVVGELNYWYFAQPYYFLSSLRSYDQVNPSETEGGRLLDAGIVHFSSKARVGLDMAMSYTSWDVYCVAPITTNLGLPSQGESLASYDLWAVGINCCSSGETNFKCGEIDKVDARAGLRQVSAEQRPYFRLAVQQAEAAYNIEASHPLFFHWVEDPVRERDAFFSAAFGNWLLADSLHFGVNAFMVLCFLVMFNKASKNFDSHLMLALRT